MSGPSLSPEEIRRHLAILDGEDARRAREEGDHVCCQCGGRPSVAIQTVDDDEPLPYCKACQRKLYESQGIYKEVDRAEKG